MSFMRTLATVAVGFAAAKGMDKYKQMGGMAGLQNMMNQSTSGGAAGMPDLAKMAESMGMGDMLKSVTGAMPGGAGPGGAGSNPMEAMMGALGGKDGAGMAGLGGLLAAFQGAAQAGGQQADTMMDAAFGGSAAGDQMEETAKLMLRAMIQAAKADGEIDADERARILDQLGDVSPEERAFVQRELEAPLDVMGLAQDTADAMKAQVYAASLMAVQVDSQAEAAYLARLAEALGLSPQMRDRMHASMGVPAFD